MSASDEAPVLFDAVVFDLDGTLVATERFWVEAARTGARRALAELGLERELPPAEAWLSMVGLPLERGFELVFGDLDLRQRAHLMARCVEEEEAALRAGGAALMDGARELLDELCARGVKLGIASNCGRGYLQTMLHGLGLERWIDEARCLDSPGVRDKADMVADLLETFGTRSAVMVGDRRGDAEAAHHNGLPHVHLEGVIKPRGEVVPCEARIGSLGELAEVLAGRARWIEGALRSLGAWGSGGVRVIGVTGAPASGKTLLARDLVRSLERSGRPARVIALESWRRAQGNGSADPLADYDVAGLRARILEPHRSGRNVASAEACAAALDPGSVLVLEGPWLLHPHLRPLLDRALHIDLPDELATARTAARCGAQDATEALLDLRRHLLPAQRAFERDHPPAELADLRLDGANPLSARIGA
jgi:phosphoglycolate phosphatase-like HAD superfamily hydrolase/uridine kinase